MIITAGLIILALLAYAGPSLVMLASVGGITVALGITRQRPVRSQSIATVVGALVGGIAAEGVHLVHHFLLGDQPGHTGFWTSAILVSLINVAAMLPVVWIDHRRLRPGPDPGETD